VINEKNVEYAPEELAIVVVDMWNRHWSTGATRRCGELAPKIDTLLRQARNVGAKIIHAPSDVTQFYADNPAYQRGLALPILQPEHLIPLANYSQPIDASDGGSDTVDDFKPNTGVWTRQTPAIYIDAEKDLISDNGDVVYSYCKAAGIKRILYAGVHTNMCVLGRGFAIKSMLSRGFDVALARDLTDAMYNPAKPPYVSHADGTNLVIAYIEKFYAPTFAGLETVFE
jgi:nicotinamidase-related amidase